MNSSELLEVEAEYLSLIDSQRTLLLSSCSDDGDAEISYAPYLYLGDVFYVFVSQLAKHTHNMLRRRQASIMFIQPEAEAANPFARQRLTFNCRVAEIDKSDPSYSRVLDALQERFGEVVSVLRSLDDFHLLMLTPSQGQYVAGFGKAFSVDPRGGA